jgi:hypothetical protein
MGNSGLVFLAALFAALPTVGATPPAYPTLLSSFPLGGSLGSSLSVSVRGENLKGAYQVLFDCPQLRGQIRTVQDLKPEPQETKERDAPKALQAASLEVAISESAEPGAHSFRIVTPRGVSGPLWFVVNAEPGVSESEAKHGTIGDAQLLKVPVVVNGMLNEPGQLDYYSFDVLQGQELQFELLTFALKSGSVNADPILALYEPGKSWFSNQKGARLEVNDESRPGLGEFSDVTSHRLPRLTHRFEKSGRYIAEVGTNQGEGGPDYSYQLRIVPVPTTSHQKKRWGPIVRAHAQPDAPWEKRTFPGILGPDRIEQLMARGAAMQDLALPSQAAIVHEDEPNETPDRALTVPIPAIVEGTLERPGDVDYFKFKVAAGQKLAFEVETPYLPPPFFNPRITVLDASGKEVLENIFKSLGGDGDDWIKTIEPRTIYTFQESGEYRLKVHDLTTQLGGSNFVYRLLIRPQIPHVGKVEMRSVTPPARIDHLNLAAGESIRVSVGGDLEEGFQGDVAIDVDNLPPGVRALGTVSPTSEKPTAASGKVGGEINRERFRSPRQTTLLTFVADANAPPTREPRIVELKAQPIVQGKPARQFTVQRILLAVTPAATPEAAVSQRNSEQISK